MYNFLLEQFKDKIDEYKEIESKDLIYSEDLIKSCQMNHCGKYNKSWTCPPAIGSQSELLKTYQNKYKKVFLFSKIQKLEDSFDIESMNEGRKKVEEILKELRTVLEGDYQILGPGACSICKDCTYPTSPCRFPELAYNSLEGLGINVIELAKLCSMKYYNGINTVTYFAAIFYN